jgi:hypothetical protein
MTSISTPAVPTPLPPLTVTSILTSGWGLFMLVSGAISIAMDVSRPQVAPGNGQSLPLFGAGSAILGWLTIVLVMVGPAALMRKTGVAPIHKALGLVWCLAVFVGWHLMHALAAEGSTSQPPRPNLSMVGGLVLCWRLLTRRAE